MSSICLWKSWLTIFFTRKIPKSFYGVITPPTCAHFFNYWHSRWKFRWMLSILLLLKSRKRSIFWWFSPKCYLFRSCSNKWIHDWSWIKSLLLLWLRSVFNSSTVRRGFIPVSFSIKISSSIETTCIHCVNTTFIHFIHQIFNWILGFLCIKFPTNA